MRAVGFAFVAMSLALATCRTYDTIYTSDAGGQCVPPALACNGSCVDPTTDRENCGACGNACTTTQLCSPGDGGSSCVECGAGFVACGASGAAFCTDTTTDSRNCGSCGNACDTGLVCNGGQCICPLTTCGSACIDTQTDVNNCGGCGTVCPSGGPHEGAICMQAHCGVVCAPFYADCDGIGTNGCESNLQTGSTSCGACGRTCQNNGACSGGLCATTQYASGSSFVGAAVDSSFVYWAEHGSTGAIHREPIGGGTVQTYFADTQATLLLSDATHLVWLDLNTTIQSRLLTGGPVTLLVTTSGIRAMYVDSGFVYYGTSAGVVARVPIDGSTGPTTITSVSSPSAIVADATNVYVASSNGDVVSAPASASNAIATTFATGALTEVLAIDATHVYWVSGAGDVVQALKSSGAPTTLASNQTIATNLVTDGTLLFWGASDGSIRELAVAGGKPFVIANGAALVSAIAVDATSVYWTSPTQVTSTSK